MHTLAGAPTLPAVYNTSKHELQGTKRQGKRPQGATPLRTLQSVLKHEAELAQISRKSGAHPSQVGMRS
jgi:hypothetical protein